METMDEGVNESSGQSEETPLPDKQIGSEKYYLQL
jgi:hypothetical protein